MKTYYRMAMRKAKEHRELFLGGNLDKTISNHYSQLATMSHEQQVHQENNDKLSFDAFLANYWKSSKTEQQSN